jgi:hypothetical protein
LAASLHAETNHLECCLIIPMDWKPIATAPYAGDLEIAVIKKDGCHAILFPCRRVVGGWLNADTRRWIKVRPTHWRMWPSRAN